MLHVYSLRLLAVEQLRDEIQQLLEDFERSGSFAATTGWIPPVDVCETDKSFIVRVELPGVDASHIDVTVAGAYLRIEGTKPSDDEEGTTNRLCLERSSGPFCRVLRLSPQIDPEAASAELRGGVLVVTVPKLLERRQTAVRIPISMEGEQ